MSLYNNNSGQHYGKNIRYAEEIVLKADSEKKLQKLLDKAIKEKGEERINY